MDLDWFGTILIYHGLDSFLSYIYIYIYVYTYVYMYIYITKRLSFVQGKIDGFGQEFLSSACQDFNVW